MWGAILDLSNSFTDFCLLQMGRNSSLQWEWEGASERGETHVIRLSIFVLAELFGRYYD